MMQDSLLDQGLRDLILNRARRRGLTVDPIRMGYANETLFAQIPKENRERILVVGVGHGHDILMGLLRQDVERVVGVDPFIETDGNGDQDYEELMDSIKRLGLQDRFQLHRMPIETYSAVNPSERFDAILAVDVLHHIVVTRSPLSRSTEFPNAVQLFKRLHTLLKPGGKLLIKEVERSGLRPFLYQTGILKGEVDYATKQNWQEWRRAATGGGFSFVRRTVYTPYRLRTAHRFLNNQMGLRTACNGYYLTFEKVG